MCESKVVLPFVRVEADREFWYRQWGGGLCLCLMFLDRTWTDTEFICIILRCVPVSLLAGSIHVSRMYRKNEIKKLILVAMATGRVEHTGIA